jgi:folate-binding protein YgfZ
MNAEHNMTSEFCALLPGAVAVPEGLDAGIAWHYGDPLREQRILAQGAGLVVRDNRDVLTVTGADRLSWLHSITSQHLSDLKDGDSTQVLVLSPHGHVEQHWQLTELGETAWIDTEPGAAAEVLGYLQKMIFMRRVEPVDVSASWGILTLAGPASAEVLASFGGVVPEPAHALPLATTLAGFIRSRDEETIDLMVPRDSLTEVAQRLLTAGAEPVGAWAYEARRVSRAEPRLGMETDHKTIPHEVGWIGTAVHLNKGCYRGQETVARVQNLGKPPRRLVLLHLAGESDELPKPGTAVEMQGRTVGFLGTAVQHYELGPVALAVVKRTIADGTELVVEGAPARVG